MVVDLVDILLIKLEVEVLAIVSKYLMIIEMYYDLIKLFFLLI
jgi:hypothetical protein